MCWWVDDLVIAGAVTVPVRGLSMLAAIFYIFFVLRCSGNIIKQLNDYHLQTGLKQWDFIEPAAISTYVYSLFLLNTSRYTNYELIYKGLSEIQRLCPEIVRVYSIGYTVEGRNLWAISLGDNPTIHEPGEPEVKLVANIHGNEPVGKQILLQFAKFLCMNYRQKNELITQLLTDIQIHLLPSMNPDGFKTSIEGDFNGTVGRGNKNGVDLNRNFPNLFSASPEISPMEPEPETLAVMQWTSQYSFVLSLSFHGGALVAVYPYDAGVNNSIYYSSTPDDVAFRHLASVYSMAHARMFTEKPTCGDKFFGGVSNGNAWYPVYGSMMDWNYLAASCMEVTIELDCQKYPPASSLPDYWRENKLSLLSFVAQALRSLRGYTIDGSTGRVLGEVSIHVVNNSHTVRSTKHLGEYWRLLPPTGSFLVWASKDGYFPTSAVTVDAGELPNLRHGHADQLNFTLWPNTTAVWSASIDFDIALNRLPQYVSPTGTVREVIQSMTETSGHHRFYALHDLSGKSADDDFAVQLSVGHFVQPKPSNATVSPGDAIQSLPGRLRVLLLAGAHPEDLITTEMTLRLLRHYITGVDRLEQSVAHLLASQLIFVPYLNGSRIPQMLQDIRTNGDNFFDELAQHNYCPNLFNDTDVQSSLDSLKHLIRRFSPHLILVLETGISSPTGENRQADEINPARVNRAVPIYPVSSSSNPLQSNQMQKLLEQYTLGATFVDDQQSTSCQPRPLREFLVVAAVDQASSRLHETYEKIAMVVSFQVDQYNGIFPILLERELERIDFSSPEELIRQLELLASERSGCGNLSSIGTSRMNKPIYLFEMGANITSLPDIDSIESRQLTDETEWLERRFHSITKHNTSMSDSWSSSWEASVPPRVVLVGNLHGQDRLTPQLLVNFVKVLCENRGRKTAVDRMLSSVRVAVLPMPDPDGLNANWMPLTPSKAQQYCPATPRMWNQKFGVDSGYLGPNRANAVDLWQELIDLTKSRSAVRTSKWWWWRRRNSRSNRLVEDPFTRLHPETKHLVFFLRNYTPTGVITFPSGIESAIDYGVDPSESEYASQCLQETYDWLCFIGTILSPSFQSPAQRCQLPIPAQVSDLDRSGHPPDGRRRPGAWEQVKVTETRADTQASVSLTGAAALALSLVSVNPEEAGRATGGTGRYTSLSYPPPLPLFPPISLGLTLCPRCQQASPIGVARVWTDFRLPSLLIGLIEQTSLTATGSFGLLGQVLSASSQQPIAGARVHIDYIRSELSTGPQEQRGFFRVALPPNEYRLTVRAAGYYDHVQIVTVKLSRNVRPHLFQMIPVGSGWSPTAIHLFRALGYSLLSVLCALTAWWSWRSCCKPRLPYAVARRENVSVVAGGCRSKMILLRVGATSSQAKDSRGAYHLVPMATVNNIGVEHEDEEVEDEQLKPSEALLAEQHVSRSEAELVVADAGENLERDPFKKGTDVLITTGRWSLRKPKIRRFQARTNKGRGVGKEDRQNLLLNSSCDNQSVAPGDDELEEVDLV